MDTIQTELAAAIARLPVIPNEQAAENDRAEAAAAIAKARHEFDQSIGPRYAGATLENYEATTPSQLAALAAISDIVADAANFVRAGRGLIIHGPVGTGKDHFLAVAGFAAIEAGATVLWANGVDLFGEMRDRIGENRPEAGFVEQYARPSVLILSDPIPPTGAVTPYQAAVLFRIIDKRYRARRSTWVSVNVEGGADLRDRIGAQTADRLKHDAVVVACNWPSFRRTTKSKTEAQPPPG